MTFSHLRIAMAGFALALAAFSSQLEGWFLTFDPVLYAMAIVCWPRREPRLPMVTAVVGLDLYGRAYPLSRWERVRVRALRSTLRLALQAWRLTPPLLLLAFPAFLAVSSAWAASPANTLASSTRVLAVSILALAIIRAASHSDRLDRHSDPEQSEGEESGDHRATFAWAATGMLAGFALQGPALLLGLDDGRASGLQGNATFLGAAGFAAYMAAGVIPGASSVIPSAARNLTPNAYAGLQAASAVLTSLRLVAYTVAALIVAAAGSRAPLAGIMVDAPFRSGWWKLAGPVILAGTIGVAAWQGQLSRFTGRAATEDTATRLGTAHIAIPEQLASPDLYARAEQIAAVMAVEAAVAQASATAASVQAGGTQPAGSSAASAMPSPYPLPPGEGVQLPAQSADPLSPTPEPIDTSSITPLSVAPSILAQASEVVEATVAQASAVAGSVVLANAGTQPAGSSAASAMPSPYPLPPGEGVLTPIDTSSITSVPITPSILAQASEQALCDEYTDYFACRPAEWRWYGTGLHGYLNANPWPRPHNIYTLLWYELGVFLLPLAGLLAWWLWKVRAPWQVVASVLVYGMLDDASVRATGAGLLAITTVSAAAMMPARDQARFPRWLLGLLRRRAALEPAPSSSASMLRS